MALGALLYVHTTDVIAQPDNVIYDPEAYAVYATVLPLGPDSTHKPVEYYAILQETRGGQSCPNDRTPLDWRPVAEAFKQENDRVWTLLPGYDVGRPYVLVSAAEVRRLLRQVGFGRDSRSGWPEAYQQFPGSRLLAVSAVGFDPPKTRAIVAVQYNCGLSPDGRLLSLDCHGGHRVALEKVDGRWVIAEDIPSCLWIA